MALLNLLLHQAKEVPEYFLALKGAVAVLAMGLPIYVGLRYFLYRRRLVAPLSLTVNFVGIFVLYAGLAFLLASPLAGHVYGAVITAYLFVTCLVTAFSIVSLVDLFLIQHYLSSVKKTYVSPPLRTVIKLAVFCVVILPIFRFVLNFNPLALIAIPTIATAGIAFALQDTLKAFIAGVGLGHLIRLGEWVAFQDKEGRVVDIDWARTTLETVDGQRVFIPNSLLQTGVFLNYTTGSPVNRQALKVSASYDSPPVHVKETLLKCAQFVPGVAVTPPPQVALLEYADSGIVYSLFYWVEDYTRRVFVQDDVLTRVWYAFQREGLSIPYPTRTLYLHTSADAAKAAALDLEKSLQRWSLAEAFFAEELQELSRATFARRFAPGEVIVRQGDAGQSVFVISEGNVEVFITPALDRHVATLGPGEIFGEMSFLTGEPRSATVRAKTAVEVLEIEKAGLQNIMTKRPELSERLAALVGKRQAAMAALPVSGGAESPPKAAQDDGPLALRIRRFFGLP